MENYIYSYHKVLNKKIFENGKIKDNVRNILLKIANFAIEKSKISKKKVKDIILTGSLAGYNYNKFSDLDLHIVYDLSFIKNKLGSGSGYTFHNWLTKRSG